MGDKKPVGEIKYGYGEHQVFYDPEKYIQAFKEALHEMGPMGIKPITLTSDPVTRKAIDDLIWGAFDEENPCSLDHYKKKFATAAAEEQTELGHEDEELNEDLEL